ncbi:MAG: hypothetical protein JO043_06050 [Candidatus Eremiobacteraeota bacterium]|nr:hypothetical protein [Candidatus Eremiobacteraeota bacterium]
MRTMSLAFVTFFSVVTCTGIASAASLKAGDTLTYTMTSHTSISGGNLPAQAYKAQPTVVTTFTMEIKAVDADGTGHVHVKRHREPPPGMVAWQVAALEKQANAECDVTLTKYGGVLAAVDDSYQTSQASAKPDGMSLAQYRDQIVAQANDPGYRANEAARELKGDFAAGNAVALSVARRKSLGPGDGWKAVVDGAAYDVRVTGKAPFEGHSTTVFDVKSGTEFQSGSTTADATVYYDVTMQRVVGIYSATHTKIQITGMENSTTSDFVLQQ